jgi:hypothetical protein
MRANKPAAFAYLHNRKFQSRDVDAPAERNSAPQAEIDGLIRKAADAEKKRQKLCVNTNRSRK